jgi:hypothetical protein
MRKGGRMDAKADSRFTEMGTNSMTENELLELLRTKYPYLYSQRMRRKQVSEIQRRLSDELLEHLARRRVEPADLALDHLTRLGEAIESSVSLFLARERPITAVSFEPTSVQCDHCAAPATNLLTRWLEETGEGQAVSLLCDSCATAATITEESQRPRRLL